ncbi:MAG: hypothetical protein ACRD8K_08325 [Nitrososphaeraceae archaeon]
MPSDIRKSIQQQSSLLDKIGTAQMQQEIEYSVFINNKISSRESMN